MSQVQICNRALSEYLGEERIDSINEDSTAARACKLHYDDVLTGLLERHWFNFSKGRQAMALVTNDRDKEWLFAYKRPNDALAIRWVNDVEQARAAMRANLSPDIERENAGQTIYCDVSGAVCEYTKLITDTNEMPQSFRDALSAAIAGAIAQDITEDEKRTREARRAAEQKFLMAVQMDDRNTPPVKAGVPQYLLDRGIE